jgi:hypothetical protein
VDGTIRNATIELGLSGDQPSNMITRLDLLRFHRKVYGSAIIVLNDECHLVPSALSHSHFNQLRSDVLFR